MKHRIFAVMICLLFAIPMTILPASAQEDTVGSLQILLPPFTALEAGSNCTAMGCLTADAVRYAAGTDLAIANAEDIVSSLPQGGITYDNIARVFASDRQIGIAEVSGPQLRALLEGCLSQITLDMSDESIDAAASSYGGFPNPSGFTLRYDASAPPGERVYAITLENGSKLDLEDMSARYTVAASVWLLEGNYNGIALDYQTADISLTQALEHYIRNSGSELTSLEWNRVKAIGVSGNTLVSLLPTPILIGSVILIWAMIHLMRKQFKNTRPDWLSAEEAREERQE